MRLDAEARPAWMAVDFPDAVRASGESRELQALARELHGARGRKQAKRIASLIRGRLPYRFDGASHEILGWDAALSRGYGACADAAAAAAAVLLMTGYTPHLCYETVKGSPDYAHVRIYVAESLVEPWPKVRRPVHGCTLLEEVAALL